MGALKWGWGYFTSIVHNHLRLSSFCDEKFPSKRAQEATNVHNPDDCARVAESGLKPSFGSPHLDFPHPGNQVSSRGYQKHVRAFRRSLAKVNPCFGEPPCFFCKRLSVYWISSVYSAHCLPVIVDLVLLPQPSIDSRCSIVMILLASSSLRCAF